MALAGVGFLQLVADLFSALALLALLQQPSPPVALVIGYWLTTAGLVAGTGGIALAGLRGMSLADDVDATSQVMPRRRTCCEQVFNGLVAVLFFPAFVFKIHINVWWLIAFFRYEAFEQQMHA